jgi:hypothetical protein
MWIESSFNKLYSSAVDAFPHTRKRQYATDTINVTRIEWMPYIGMNTLLLRSHVENFGDGGGEYNPLILFKNVKYHPRRNPGLVEIVSSDTQQHYFIEKLNSNRNDVLLRCSCGDYFWRFNYYNRIDRSLYGAVRSPYQGEYRINPREMPGMCKHLMKLGISLQESGFLREFRTT